MDLAQYLVFCIENRCNNRCAICMLGHGRTYFKKFSLRSFMRTLDVAHECFPHHPGIIFSGAEPTLHQELPQFASYARSKGFRHIMIQTNGRLLANKPYARALIDHGINEFFISLPSAASKHELYYFGRRGALSQTHKALKNLNSLHAKIITNTVITSYNYAELPKLASFLKRFPHIKEMHFWYYLPLNSKSNSRLFVPYQKSWPFLTAAIAALKKRRKKIVLKYFPECILERYKKLLHNPQPEIIVGAHAAFWRHLQSARFQRCPSCRSKKCEGLPLFVRRNFKTMWPRSYNFKNWFRHYSAPEIGV